MKKTLLTLSLLVSTVSFVAQTDLEKTKSTISKNNIEGHIYFLASDELRGRQTGTPEIDIAASYLANTLRRYGVKPANNGSYYQGVELENISAPTKLGIRLNDFSSDKLLQLSGYNTFFNGQAVYLNFGLADDYKDKDVTGKLVIVKAGTPEASSPQAAFGARRTKAQLATEYGAAGLIELSSASDLLWGRFSNFFNSEKMGLATNDAQKLIHLWLQDIDGSIRSKLETSKKINANVNIDGIKKTPVKAKNVVGMVEGSDPKLKDQFVIYSAHYDHIGVGAPNAQKDSIFNGARDNAVGVVTVLSAAENIAKYPTKRSALFILFTAEEKGLLGSKWYVENPVIPLNKMVYCFNSDNGGYNDTSLATIIGLGRTTAEKHIKSAVETSGLKAIDDPAPEQGLFDRSDNVNFAAKGIPAPTFSLGFTAFDAEIGKYYHQQADNPDNVDYDYLEKFFTSYVLACRLIANDPEIPFWTAGDKYYEAGVKLYNRKALKN
ncbi:MAG: M28 family peptidase [Flavobacteriaceae bacterium]|nr:M28 family peptidase [Flavobacteriaceae bacterium]